MNLKTQKTKFFLSLFIITFLCIITCASAISLDEFTATPLTTTKTQLNESPSIAMWGQTIHVVWNSHDSENSTIKYKKSNDNGKTWENTTDLLPDMTQAYYPAIAVNKNTVHVVWIDYRDTNSEIYYSRSIDNGNTWDTARRLTYDSPRKNTVYDVVIVADGNNVYLAWKDYRTNTSEIFFKKSRDGGITWDADQQLTNDYSPSYYPSLVVQDNYLYIAFQDGGLKPDISFLKSDSSGDKWSEKTYIVDTQGAAKVPCLAISEDKLYLVYQDDSTGVEKIYFKTSMDRGVTWGDALQISNNSASSINPKIYAWDENILVLWQDLINGKFCISYKTSDDSGKTWSECKQLTTDIDCYSVGVCGEEDNIHIVYQDYHVGSWANIWHVGNSSKTPIHINQESSEPTDNRTAGFQFVLLILAILIVMFTIKQYKKKGRN